MERRNFADVLKSAEVDIKREYERLYTLFYKCTMANGNTPNEICENNFRYVPFRGTCLTLDDFQKTHNLSFKYNPPKFDLNYFLIFCEFTYNILNAVVSRISYGWGDSTRNAYFSQLRLVMEKIGYQRALSGEVYIFVPKDQAAVSVSEIVDESISYRVIEYNHHSMAGDLERKRATLLLLADQLEPKRKQLKNINATLEDHLFYLFNTVSIRHNNTEQGTKNYHQAVADMDEKTLERWYDDTYQLCLLAFLELDNLDRKNRVSQLKKEIG